MFEGDFLLHLFFGSFLEMVLSIVFFAIGLYLAAKLLDLKENSRENVLRITLIAFVFAIGGIFFQYVDYWFLMAIQFIATLIAVKHFYKTDYPDAFGAVIVANILFILIKGFFVPGALPLF
ncbi:MAG: hypothetical protein JW772_01280 [Candidatus Diapherotrites archaeon]|nr:hypothetical protein [Candidatus Diapherotrites archaeon]